MNTKIILAVVLAIVVIAAWAVNAHRNKGFRTVSSEEFAGLIGDTATVQLLDVRTKEEYEEGHIADALPVLRYGQIHQGGQCALSQIMALFTSEGCTVHQDNPARCQKSIGYDYKGNRGLHQSGSSSCLIGSSLRSGAGGASLAEMLGANASGIFVSFRTCYISGIFAATKNDQ